MKRQSIAVDLDDVIADHVESFVEFSNAAYGTNLKAKDYTEKWDTLWNVNLKEVERRASEFHKPEIAAAYGVKKESKAALEILKQHYDLYIVSSRSESLVDTTKNWVDKHFREIFKDVHVVEYWFSEKRITKAEICKQIGAEYLIDDAIYHCNTAAKAGIKTILFGGYPWNENTKLEKDITRCDNWTEVLKYFNLG